MEKAKTKDEKFVLKLYSETKKSGESEAVFDRYQIGALASLPVKAVDTICNLLAQANFIKKREGNEVFLTPHGIKLAEEIRRTKGDL